MLAKRCEGDTTALTGNPSSMQTKSMAATTGRKYAACAFLIFVQVTGAAIYKSSSTDSAYKYSTYSALCIAEALKLIAFAAMHCWQRPTHPDSKCLTYDPSDAQKSHASIAKIVALAFMYFVNNQLVLFAYLRVTPALIELFKSASSATTALLSYFLLNRTASPLQWVALVQQVCGLVVVQFDACSKSMRVPLDMLVVLMFSLSLSSLASVWNEHQLKRLPLSTPAQCVVLYSGGMVMNFLGHLYMAWTVPDTPGFFQGYDAASVSVVLNHVCTGFAVVWVYKYADAVIKALSASITTVLVIILSCVFFGMKLNPVLFSGCTVVVLSVFTYSFLPSVEPKR
jgi:drug/metabolite transporter (DMT)-like permease